MKIIGPYSSKPLGDFKMTDRVMGIMKPEGQHCVEYAEWFCSKQTELVKRAAELLRQADRMQLGSVTWEKDRDQWLKDYDGMEK